MRLTQKAILPAILLVSMAVIHVDAVDDSAHKEFYAGLEDTIRADYRLCTGDTTRLSLAALIRWKGLIDSVTSLPSYPALEKHYLKLAGIEKSNFRPCEFVSWIQEIEHRNADIERVIAVEKRRREAYVADSLFSVTEAAQMQSSECDLAGIPFGVSKRAFKFLANLARIGHFEDEGNFFRCDSLKWGDGRYTAAFFLDKNGRYVRYELESDPYPADSLDKRVRHDAERMAQVFERVLRKPPRHIYRIGFFDIVPGRLALYKIWTGSHPPVYIGLSTFRNTYYAKTVVKRNAENRKSADTQD